MEFDLRQLEIFCKVVELGSFSRAAEAVHLAQASVSERIATLEEAVGARLLDRLGRRTEPTAAGKLLYRHGMELLRRRRMAVEELRDFLGMRAGPLVVGASTIPGEHILPGLLVRFRRSHPDVAVQVDIAGSGEVLRRVSAGALELGIVGSTGNEEKELTFSRLWADELVLVAAPSGEACPRLPVPPARLKEIPIVVRGEDSGTRRVLERHMREAWGLDPSDLDVVAVVSTSTAARQSALEGLGATFISSRAVADDLNAGRLVRIHVEGAAVTRHFHLVRHSHRTLSPLCRAFLDMLRLLGFEAEQP